MTGLFRLLRHIRQNCKKMTGTDKKDILRKCRVSFFWYGNLKTVVVTN